MEPMETSDWIMFTVLAVLCVFMGMVIFAERVPLEPLVQPARVGKELPELCAPFYNDGTGRWAECMHVGPK